MEELLNKIYEALKTMWKRQGYEYRFHNFDGTETSKQLMISNSIEYEFINTGNSKVIINDNLILYPEFTERGLHRIKFFCNKNEKDLTVYTYRFETLGSEPVAGTLINNAVGNHTFFIYTMSGDIRRGDDGTILLAGQTLADFVKYLTGNYPSYEVKFTTVVSTVGYGNALIAELTLNSVATFNKLQVVVKQISK